MNFDNAWEDVPAVMKLDYVGCFAAMGGDYDYKYALIYDDPGTEEHAFKGELPAKTPTPMKAGGRGIMRNL